MNRNTETPFITKLSVLASVITHASSENQSVPTALYAGLIDAKIQYQYFFYWLMQQVSSHKATLTF